MYNLSVTNQYGETLNFNQNPTYSIVSVKGLNPPRAVINTSSIATTDGAVFNSSRVDVRNIVITVVLNDEIEKSRIALYRYFPIKEEITLKFSNATRDVKIIGYVETFECDLFENSQRAQISVICPQAYFTDEELTVIEFANITNAFEFPVNIPAEGIAISEVDLQAVKNIVYTGDAETGFVIDIYVKNNIVEPAIRNKLTNEVFVLALELLSGDKLTINTKKGEKSVILLRDGVETNEINKIYQGSKWLTVKTGDNVFSFEAVYGAENATVVFTIDQLYSGV